jgi:signal transduction histidine kinase
VNSRLLAPSGAWERPAGGAERGVLSLAVVVVAGLGVLLGVVAVTLKVADSSHPPADTALSAAGGFLFLAAGLVTHVRRPANGTALLMVLVGLAFFAEDLQLSRDPLVFSVGLLFTAASAPPIVHLVLAFPHGHLRSRPARVLTAGTYLVVLVLAVLGTATLDWPAYYPSRPANVLLVQDLPAVAEAAGTALRVVGVAVAAGVVVSLAHRYLTGTRQLRAPLTPPLLIAILTAAASAAGTAAGPASSLYPVLLAVYQVGFCLWPMAFLLGALVWRPGPVAITDLLVAAHRPTTAAELRDLLATALRDPSLRLGHWDQESGTYIDGAAAGDPLDLRESPGRVVVQLADGAGRPVGVLVRRDVPWEDARLANAVAALAGLVLDNQRLTAEVSARLAEVHASRARLVSLADEERRRVERDLHDGAQQRLVTVALGIQLARRQVDQNDTELSALLAATADGVEAAITELRELAQGIHPALLTEAGLGPAVAELVERTPLPVTLDVPALPRLSSAVEATAYFVVAEALTNALKHGGAGRVLVRLEPAGERLRVEVADDGNGGAELVAGSGLGGLRDRVRALDGELAVTSRPGEGTSVVAEIPRR